MKWFFAILAVLFFHSAYAGIGSVGEPNVIWSQSHIHVCWKDNEDPLANFTELEKNTVRAVIETEYTIERVGIDFYGWESCSQLSNSLEVHLELRQSSDEVLRPIMKSGIMGFASIGESGLLSSELYQDSNDSWKVKFGYYLKSDKQPFVQLRADRHQKSMYFTYLENLSFVAIHEFGHVAGLRHEYIRSEAAYDRNCYFRENIKEKLSSSTKKYGTYDANSIMNYCWMDMLYLNGTTWYQSEESKVRQNRLARSNPLKKLPAPKMDASLHFSILPVLSDPSLYLVSYDVSQKMFKYQIKIGLSQRDVQTLRCMYVDPTEKGCVVR